MSTPETWSERSDAEVMCDMSRDSATAMRALLDRYAPRILALCRRMVSNVEDAEDVAADVFAELWLQRERFDPQRGQPLTYIMMLTRSRCLDRLRKFARESDGKETNHVLLEDLAVSLEPTPFEHLALGELHTLAQQALAELPNRQRELLELAFFDGLTHREISESQDMPLGTVKTLIRNGLESLRSTLRRSGHHHS